MIIRKGYALKNMSTREWILFILKYIFLAMCVIVALFPLLWVLMSSFKTNAEILTNGLALPSRYNLDGYKMALDISPIIKYFFNSIVITGVATSANVLILAMSGYVFARKEFRFKNTIYLILSISLVIPMTALLHPVYSVMGAIGLTNTRAGLMLIYTALNLPLSLLIMRATFSTIPRSLEEAAYIDGAGFLRTFFQVMLPCAKSGLVSAGILTFLNSWNEFTFALVLTSSNDVRTLPLSLGYFTSQFSFNYTAMFAAITMAMLPSIIVFAFFQNQIVSSLTSGSVKE